MNVELSQSKKAAGSLTYERPASDDFSSCAYSQDKVLLRSATVEQGR